MNFTPLNFFDLQWALRRTPKKLLELLTARPGRLFIAGGFIRACVSRERVSDIDVFAPSVEEAKSAALELVGGNEERVHTTGNAFTIRGFSLPIQFVHRWKFDKPEDCIQSFDFTIAMALFYCESYTPADEEGGVKQQVKWASLCDERFYQDLAAKRLIYTQPIRNEDAGGSLLRVLKFYQRGYLIPLSSFGATIARMVKDINFDQELGSTIGIERNTGKPVNEDMLARVITGKLREVDPLLDPDHLAHLPSETEEGVEQSQNQ